MLNIEIKTKPNNEQRYNTVGDYITNADGGKQIVVSKMGDTRYELLVAIHELIESALCDERGISEESIDVFDMQFENKRSPTDMVSEPGDDTTAPYNKEHQFATTVEKMLAEELGIDWEQYCEKCQKLTAEYLEQKK